MRNLGANEQYGVVLRDGSVWGCGTGENGRRRQERRLTYAQVSVPCVLPSLLGTSLPSDEAGVPHAPSRGPVLTAEEAHAILVNMDYSGCSKEQPAEHWKVLVMAQQKLWMIAREYNPA